MMTLRRDSTAPEPARRVPESHSHPRSVYASYAKINLGLRIVGRRPDGFHNIETVFHRIDLADFVDFAPGDGISIVTNSPEVPADTRNICHAAATSLQQHLDCAAGVRIILTKAIPVGAGLGGGSSDAATVLRYLPRFWGRSADEKMLQSIACDLGSDVPFFLGERSALARGRGEILEYVDLDIPFAILLVHPGIRVSTSWAYSQARPTGEASSTSLLEILVSGIDDPERLRKSLRNDFEAIVFNAHPEVKRVRDTMIELGATYASMSGSGSSVFGFFPDTNAADTASAVFRDRRYTTSVTPPHFRPTFSTR